MRSRRFAAAGTSLVVAVAACVALGLVVEGHRPPGWDVAAFRFVSRHQLLPENDEPLAAAPFVGGVVMAGALALLLHGRRIRDAVLCVAAVGSAGILGLLLKHVFVRPSPTGAPTSYPSGHALLTMATVAALLVVTRGLALRAGVAVLGAAAVAVVGVAVIRLRWHYPSDVLGGWCAGLACVGAVWLSSAVAERFRSPGRRARRPPRTP